MSDYSTNDIETYYIDEERIEYSTEAWESIQRGLGQTETHYIGSFVQDVGEENGQ